MNSFIYFAAAMLLLAVASPAAARCPTRSLGNRVCAVLYDDEDCSGWELEIREGYTALSFWKKNDAESVSVERGCRLIGYDHDDERVSKRGDSVTVDARRSRSVLNKNFEGRSELEERISAVECRCGAYGGELEPPERPRRRIGNSGRNCNGVTFPGDSACIVYDDEDCQVEDWEHPLFFADGESKSFSILKSARNFHFKNTIESVSVRAGCTLEVYDDSDFSDDAHAFEAPPTADLHHTLDRSFRTRSLDDDIESLRCWC